MSSTEHLFTAHYYSRATFVDGTTAFHALISQYRPLTANILEIGSGPSNPTSDFLATLGLVDGVDITNDVMNNRALRAGYAFDGRKLPFGDGSYDLCVSNYVLEHVSEPAMHFAEIARVLKPGGKYAFRTPNMWHYVAVAGRLLPFWVHQRLSPKLRANDEATYPTYYRANTASRLVQLCWAAGLQLRLELVEKEPCYARLSPALFYPMMLYERTVNRFSTLARFRANIFGVATRPGAYE